LINEDLRQLWFQTDIRSQILRVAFELSDDPQYSKGNAIDDLLKITEILEITAGHASKVSTPHND
jgi:hypothetical protein